MAMLDASRTAFAQGDYAGALSACNQAVAKLPNSGPAHEFRALILFALKRYDEAAGPVYAVLSAGPGWDWATLSSMYPDVSAYTQQLRALEQYVNEHPNSPAARFLLAYHYMCCGFSDAAATQLKAVVQLNPKDQLSAQLLSAMTSKTATPAPATAPPSAPPKAVNTAALVGPWKATRPDGAAISLDLTKDGKYTWTYTQKDKPRQFSGTYTIADNLLILKEGNNTVMVGQVTQLADDRFNFRMPGDNPGDPGLTFSK